MARQGRDRPLNRLRKGVYLVATDDSKTVYSDEVVRGKYGRQKGHLYHRDDLDEPGREDLRLMNRRRRRSEQLLPGPRRKPKQSWRLYDENGDDV